MFEYKGNIHIHTRYSDGNGTITDICAAAISAGLDFIIVTDHYTLKALPEEGYKNNLLLLVGMEINNENNHYLALDISQVVKNNTAHPQIVINSVNQQGGIGIIAHPTEYPSPFLNDGEVYNWNDWSVHDFQGIEIWNLLSQWKGSIKNIFKALYYTLNPQAALIGPYPDVLGKLDDYQKQGKKIIAFGGSDAHAPEIKLGPFKLSIISYFFSFRSINMHILLNHPLSKHLSTDKELIYNALRQGMCWVANDYYKDSQGFSFELYNGSKKWLMGESVAWMKNLQAEVLTPHHARVKLIKNGFVADVSEGKKHIFTDIGPGVYRVEVSCRHRLKYHPWIFSNSIWVS